MHVCNLPVTPAKFEDQDYRKVFFMLNRSSDISALSINTCFIGDWTELIEKA